MRWLAVLLLAQVVKPTLPMQHTELGEGRLSGWEYPQTPKRAWFEFAPEDGFGMTEVCACANPAGVHGEPLTYTRTGTAACTKRSWTTGIANGDIVKCAANQPRVMHGQFPDGGLDTAVGLLIETARTNYATESDTLANGNWTTQASGCAGPTVTYDAGVAPDGTSHATRVDFPACNGPSPNRSAFYHATAIGPATATVTSVYARGIDPGDGGVVTGSFPIHQTPNGTTYYAGYYCNFTSASWTRCSSAAYTSGATTYYVLGPDHRDTSVQLNDSAVSVLLWGAQLEGGSAVSSYIPVSGTAIQRGSDVAYFAKTGPGMETGSMAGTIVAPVGGTNTHGNSPTPIAVSSTTTSAGINTTKVYSPNSFGNTFAALSFFNDGSYIVTGTAAPTGGTMAGLHRIVFYAIANTMYGLVDGVSMSSPQTITGAYGAENYIFVGNAGNAVDGLAPVDAVISRVCRDPNPSTCR